MASLGKSVSSITRPLRNKVKPSQLMAQHPVFAAKPTDAISESTDAPSKSYDWGVGKSAPVFKQDNSAEFKKMLTSWDRFTLGGTDLWAGMFFSAFSTFSSKIPSRGH
eukprot:TRINITY_DN93975_c0_g1_i1.p1 TRINITY_DN93975_c0_g1~~TRINITY_DN93975_c0_g1_i1.p1  ORF type:complete len:108 (+),score=22.31 TRINITY_DN93975_c0_g1_i1:140-463(+)